MTRLEAAIRDRRVAVLCDRLRRHIPPGRRLLDVGAGDGRLAAALARSAAPRALRALDLAASRRDGVEVEAYDGRRLPLDDRSVDVVWVASVLHHCADPEGILRELRRVTAERLLVVEDRLESAWDRLRVAGLHHLIERTLDMPFSPRGFTSRRGWARRLSDAGFRVVATEDVAPPVPLFPANLLIIAEPA